jgi:hypothetical protein
MILLVTAQLSTHLQALLGLLSKHPSNPFPPTHLNPYNFVAPITLISGDELSHLASHIPHSSYLLSLISLRRVTSLISNQICVHTDIINSASCLLVRHWHHSHTFLVLHESCFVMEGAGRREKKQLRGHQSWWRFRNVVLEVLGRALMRS